MSDKPWAKYAVSKPSKRRNWVDPTCQPFNSVSHVSHVVQALQICEVGQIKDGLVYDKSWLNKHRISVVWLSPNDWTDGFRYGNVRFIFDWSALTKGRRFYWVEDMPAYSPTACRILLAENSYDGELANKLIEYNPEDGDGPWWYNHENDIHYRNGNFTLEFMIDNSLSLNDCIELNFVKHHPDYCCIDHRSCKERGLTRWKAGERFIGKCIERNISPPSKIISLVDDSEIAGFDFNTSLWGLLIPVFQKIKEEDYKKKIRKNEPVAKEIARAMLACFTDKTRKEEGIALATLFYDENSLVKVVQDLAHENFCLKFYQEKD